MYILGGAFLILCILRVSHSSDSNNLFFFFSFCYVISIYTPFTKILNAFTLKFTPKYLTTKLFLVICVDFLFQVELNQVIKYL